MEDAVKRVETLARAGAFGERKFLRVSVDSDAASAPQFASQLLFLNLEFEGTTQPLAVPVVVKIQPTSQFARVIQSSDEQFFNEVSMYSKILPLLAADSLDILPQYFCGVSTEGQRPEEDLVILEDLRRHGYTTGGKEPFLPPNHIKFVMTKLGQFHGLSYKAKKQGQTEVFELGKALRMKKVAKEFEELIFPCFKRGFKYASEKSPASADLLNRISDKISVSGLLNIFKGLQQPEEPFAAVIHADFNKYNLMFKFDAQDEVERVKFLDFQNSKYSDPAVDIAFTLYMNTTQETRDEHWEGIQRCYWDGVTSVEPEPGFTFEEFWSHFGARALYGYLPCSFYLPLMVDITTKVSMEEEGELTLEQRTARLTSAGGEEGERLVGQIVLDLVNRGYLDMFENNFEKIVKTPNTADSDENS